MSSTEKAKSEYIRNVIFGVEDSLVSTIGLVAGVAVSGLSGQQVVLTGVVLVFVEAFSMAVGALLSSNSAEEYEGKKEVALSQDMGNAAVMFVSYLLSGLVIIVPYVLFQGAAAVWVSVLVALLGLAVLGYWSARIAKVHWLRRVAVMVLIGGVTIVLGMVVGQAVTHLSNVNL